MKDDKENPNYLDEPYIYQAKLIEVLYNCTIGKEGMLQNETRLRSLISLKYSLEILKSPDSFIIQNEDGGMARSRGKGDFD